MPVVVPRPADEEDTWATGKSKREESIMGGEFEKGASEFIQQRLHDALVPLFVGWTASVLFERWDLVMWITVAMTCVVLLGFTVSTMQTAWTGLKLLFAGAAIGCATVALTVSLSRSSAFTVLAFIFAFFSAVERFHVTGFTLAAVGLLILQLVLVLPDTVHLFLRFLYGDSS